jgi:hypothetical protein
MPPDEIRRFDGTEGVSRVKQYYFERLSSLWEIVKLRMEKPNVDTGTYILLTIFFFTFTHAGKVFQLLE